MSTILNIAVGDSHTAEGGINAPNTNWFYQLGGYSAFSSSVNINVAVQGETVANKLTEFTSGVLPHLDGDPAWLSTDTRTVYFWCGINDLSSGRTAVATYADMKTYWAEVRAHHGRLVVFTLIPHNDFPSGAETERESLNNLILGDPSLYDIMIPIHNNRAWVSLDGKTLIPGSSLDGLHQSADINTLIANIVNSVVTGGHSPIPAPSRIGVNSPAVGYTTAFIVGRPGEYASYMYNPTTTNGQSHGLTLTAGVGSSDAVLNVRSCDATKIFLLVNGAGGVSMPQLAAGTLKVDSSGNLYTV